MEIEQRKWTRSAGWSEPGRPSTEIKAQLVLVFGAPAALASPRALEQLAQLYPGAQTVGCSTAGEIHGPGVEDDTIAATAVAFEHTRFRTAQVELLEASESRAAGQRLAATLDAADLRHVFVLSDGIRVNGTELVKGLVATLRPDVAVTGGLSGDGERFQRTLVWLNGQPSEGRIVAIGFYGDQLKVGYASLGGWDPFGPERLVTRSSGNVLFELDGFSALELYKKYLGDHAAGLPASGLLFPLSLRNADEPPSAGVVRTILGVDEATGSMTFAGDIPTGAYVRLMKANFERLIEGATGAARASLAGASSSKPPGLAVLISCVGRKLVLKQRVEEEVEAVGEILGPGVPLTGFYSYGEISPFTPQARCELHNQTMTITTFSED